MRKIIVAAVAVACLVPALALAATPAKNSNFAWCTKKNLCPFSFDTNKKATKLVSVKLYPKCSPVPPMKGDWPGMKVKKNGKFSRKGSFENVLGETINYKIVGKFVRKKKAVGTFDVDSADCSDKERKFVAKRKGKATGGFVG